MYSKWVKFLFCFNLTWLSTLANKLNGCLNINIKGENIFHYKCGMSSSFVNNAQHTLWRGIILWDYKTKKSLSQVPWNPTGFTMGGEPKLNSQNKEPPTLSVVHAQKSEGNSKTELLDPWEIDKTVRIDNDVPIEIKIKMKIPKK